MEEARLASRYFSDEEDCFDADIERRDDSGGWEGVEPARFEIVDVNDFIAQSAARSYS